MRVPPPAIIDALNELDDHVAAELLVVLRAITSALEQRYAAALERQHQRDQATGQSELWPDRNPPF